MSGTFVTGVAQVNNVQAFIAAVEDPSIGLIRVAEGSYDFSGLAETLLVDRNLRIEFENTEALTPTAIFDGGGVAQTLFEVSATGVLDITGQEFVRFERFGETLFDVSGGTLGLQNISLFRNGSSGDGGVISVTNGGSLRLDGVQINNNGADGRGGAIFAENASLQFFGTSIFANEAQGDGGAVAAIDSTLLVVGDITDQFGQFVDQPAFQFQDVSFQGNRSVAGSGGAFYLQDTSAQFIGTSFLNVTTRAGNADAGGDTGPTANIAAMGATSTIAFDGVDGVFEEGVPGFVGGTAQFTAVQSGFFDTFVRGRDGPGTPRLIGAESAVFLVSEETVDPLATASDQTISFTADVLTAPAQAGDVIYFRITGDAEFGSDFVFTDPAIQRVTGIPGFGDNLFQAPAIAGSENLSFSIRVINDANVAELDESLLISVVNVPLPLIGGPLSSVPYIIENEELYRFQVDILSNPAIVELLPAPARLTENGDAVEATVRLLRPVDFAVPVRLEVVTEGGSADAGDVSVGDFAGTVTINPGDTEASFEITAPDDTIFENAETFTVRLLPQDLSAGGPLRYGLLSPNADGVQDQTFTIDRNDEDLLIGMEVVSLGGAPEGYVGPMFNVFLVDLDTGELVTAPEGGVLISYTVGGGAVPIGGNATFPDIQPLDGVVFIDEGQSSAQIFGEALRNPTFNGFGINNTLRLVDVVVTLQPAAGPGPGDNLAAFPNRGQASFIIDDLDQPGFDIHLSNTEVAEGDSITIEVVPTAVPTAPVALFFNDNNPGVFGTPIANNLNDALNNNPQRVRIERDEPLSTRIDDVIANDPGGDTFDPELLNYIVFDPSTATEEGLSPITLTLTALDNNVVDTNTIFDPLIYDFVGSKFFGNLKILSADPDFEYVETSATTSPFSPIRFFGPEGELLGEAPRSGPGLSVPLSILDDEVANVLVNVVDGEIAEGPAGDIGSYTLRLTQTPASAVDIAISHDSSLEVSVDGGVTFGQSPIVSLTDNIALTVQVRAVDDDLPLGDRSLRLAHDIVNGPAPFEPSLPVTGVSFSVTDNDESEVSFGQVFDGSEETPVANGGIFEILLAEAAPAGGLAITIDVNAAAPVGIPNGAGVATEGDDIRTLSRTLIIPEGQTGEFFDVRPFFDNFDERPFETVTISLLDGPGYAVSGPTAASLRIFDEDQVGIRLLEDGTDTVIIEGATDSYTIQLTSAPTAPVEITVNTPDGLSTDTPVLTFTEFDWAIPQRVVLRAVNNNAVNEGPNIELTATHTVTSDDTDYDGFTVPDVVAEIVDDDFGGILVSTQGTLTPPEDGSQATEITYSILGQPTAAVTLTFDIDPNEAPGVRILDADGNEISSVTLDNSSLQALSQTVFVQANDDFIDFDGRRAVIDASITSDDAFFAGLDVDSVEVTIADDDVAGFSLRNTDLSVIEDDITDSFEIRLDSQPRQPVRIDLSSIGVGTGLPMDVNNAAVSFGGDAAAGFLFFDETNWNVWQEVVVSTTNNDFFFDGDRTGVISVAVDTTSPEYVPLSIAPLSVTITDDEAIGFTVDESGGVSSVSADGETDTIVLSLDTQPRAPVTLTFDPNAELEALAPITFTPADFGPGETTVLVTRVLEALPTVDFGINPTDLTFSLASADPDYDGLTGSISVGIKNLDLDVLANGLAGVLSDIDDLIAEILDFNLVFFNPQDVAPAFLTSFADDLVNLIRQSPVTSLTQLSDLVEAEIEAGLSSLGLGLSGNAVNVDITAEFPADTGAELLFDLSIDQTFTSTASLDTDLGIPALGLEIDGTFEPSFGYDFNLTFGFSESQGFFVETAPADTGLILSIDAGLGDGFRAEGHVGLVGLEVTDNMSGPERTGADAALTLGIDGASLPGGRLLFGGAQTPSLSELFNPTFTSGADLYLDAQAKLGDSTVFPSILFDIDGAWDGFTFENGSVSLDDAPSLAFNNISVDAGSFISDFANPILVRLNEIADPFRPIIDILTADLEVLQRLGINANLASLISAASGGRVDIQPFANNLNDLLNLINAAGTAAGRGDNILINLGSYDLALPDDGFDQDSGSARDSIRNSAPPAGGATTVADIRNAVNDPATRNFLEAIVSNNTFTFPLLTDVSEIFGLLTGRTDVTLFEARLDPLVVEGGFSRGFDILQILKGSFGGTAGFTIDLGFGFDTKGLFDWAATGFDPAQSFLIFDGFFVDDLKNGRDIDEFVGEVSIGGSVSVNAFLAKGSVSAGITGSAGIDFRDTGESFGAGDGKIRAISEIGANIATPWNLFNLEGALSAYVSARAEVLGKRIGGFRVETDLVTFEFGANGFTVATAFDGPVEGAIAFFDADFDGVQDPDEPFTLTGVDPDNPDVGGFNLAIPLEIYDHNGNGRIDANEGRIIVSGGFDIDAGDDQKVPFVMSPEWGVASPLTLLATELAAVDPAAVEAAVEAALSLPADFDLRNADPLQGTLDGDESAAAVLKRIGQLQNLIILGANSFAPEIAPDPADLVAAAPVVPDNPAREDGAIQITVAIGNRVQAGQAIDLTDAADIRAILLEAAAAVGVTPSGLDTAVADIASRNGNIAALAGAGPTVPPAIAAQVALEVADTVYGYTLENVLARVIGNSTPEPELDGALDTVAAAFDLPDDVNLTSFNAVAEVDGGNTEGLDVLAAQVQVNATLVQLAELTGAAAGEGTEAETLAALTTALANAGGKVDLTDPGTVAGLIGDIAPDLDPDVVAAAAGAVAEQNGAIQQVADDAEAAGDTSGARDGVAAVQRFAQGGQTETLGDLGSGDITPDTLEEELDAAATVADDPLIIRVRTDEDTDVTTLAIPEAAALIDDTIAVMTADGQSVVVGEDITLASGALLRVAANGTITYQPNGVFSADNATPAFVDDFSLSLLSGEGDIAEAIFIATIESVNDAPVAVADSQSTSEDTAFVIDVVANDTDLEGDALSVASVGAASQGTVVLNPDGTVTYTPDDDVNGSDSFTYVLSDGVDTVTGTVSVTIVPVQDAPVAQDDMVTTNEDMAVMGSVAANDGDVDGDDLTFRVVTGPAAGSLTLAADGSFIFDPDGDFEDLDDGEDRTTTFTYEVSDGVRTDQATASIVVQGANDAPIVTGESLSVDEDGTLTLSVLDNDIDVDGDGLTLESIGPALFGAIMGSDNGSVTYMPEADFNGIDVIPYVISDGTVSVSGTLTVSVTPVQDAPVALNDTATTDEDRAVAGDVSSNDGDIDGDDLSFSLVSMPQRGLVEFAADGSFTFDPNGEFEDLDDGEAANVSFTYEVTDGGRTDRATVALTVRGVNDTPIGVADTAAAEEDGDPVNIDVLANDTDAEGDNLQITDLFAPGILGSAITDGVTITYDPGAAFQGLAVGETTEEVISYTITDDSGATATAALSVTVSGTNDLPFFTSGSVGAAFEENNTGPIVVYDAAAGDLDGADELTFSLVDPGSDFSIDPNGRVTFSGLADFEATPQITFTVRVTDSAGGTADIDVTSDIIDVLEGPDLEFIGPNGVFGTAGNDSLVGTAGEDALFGARGDDLLIGGKGADSFVLSEGHDIIDDFFGATAATTPVPFLFFNIPAIRPADTIDLRALNLTFDDFAADARQDGADVVWEIDEETSVTIRNTQLADLTVDDFVA